MVSHEVWVANASIKELVDHCTSVKSPDEPDHFKLVHMEIADRIKEDPTSCKEAAKQIYQVLLVDNSKRFYQLVSLLEACSKNSNRLFHRCLSTTAFADAFLSSLKRVRGKHKVMQKMESKEVRNRWEKAEFQLLGLIQIWADTFMMQEDEFPGFQKVYRQLRKEGIQFPQRDPNLRMLMSSICADSPMFDYVEQIAGR